MITISQGGLLKFIISYVIADLIVDEVKDSGLTWTDAGEAYAVGLVVCCGSGFIYGCCNENEGIGDFEKIKPDCQKFLKTCICCQKDGNDWCDSNGDGDCGRICRFIGSLEWCVINSPLVGAFVGGNHCGAGCKRCIMKAHEMMCGTPQVQDMDDDNVNASRPLLQTVD